jgi:chemotaxis protein MotA
MFALVGIAVVLAAVFGGYLAEQGSFYVLLQPAELLIVGGAALGIVLIANRPAVIRKMARGAASVFFHPALHTQAWFLRSLRMLYELFAYAQRAGIAGLENDVEEPHESRIFSQYPEFLKDVSARAFLCDSLRILVIGVTSAARTGSPHGSGHGAWKVAYADFVTALMALFIVLWLMNSSVN